MTPASAWKTPETHLNSVSKLSLSLARLGFWLAGEGEIVEMDDSGHGDDKRAGGATVAAEDLPALHARQNECRMRIIDACGRRPRTASDLR